MNRTHHLVSLVALSLTLVGIGCAAPTEDVDVEYVGQTHSLLSATGECTPAVVVIRHAEDADPAVGESCVVEEKTEVIPGGVQKIHQSCLTGPGKQHAVQYRVNLDALVMNAGFCPISRAVTMDPWTSVNGAWPSANPLQTILPFANAKQTPIAFWGSNTTFDQVQRAKLRPANGTSVLVSWTKEGLSGSSGLLASMKRTTSAPAFATRDMVYVFSNPDAQEKYDLTEYTQFFQDSSGYFAKVNGSAFDPAAYYRFNDGTLKSNTPGSPDLVPSDMTMCKGTSCIDGVKGISLAESLRR